jgi:hypothetical protein
MYLRGFSPYHLCQVQVALIQYMAQVRATAPVVYVNQTLLSY